MITNWILILALWTHDPSKQSEADKTFYQNYSTRQECVTNQKMLSYKIEKKWPSTSTTSICMLRSDFVTHLPLDKMHNPSIETSE